MPPSRSIGIRLALAIRQRRELLGLTQEEAAHRAGLSVRYWRYVESDEPPATSMATTEQILIGLDWSWPDLALALSGSDRDRDDHDAKAAERLFRAAWRKATQRERDTMAAGLRVIASKRSQR